MGLDASFYSRGIGFFFSLLVLQHKGKQNTVFIVWLFGTKTETMPSKRTKVSTAAHQKGSDSLEESSNDGQPEKEASMYPSEVPQQGQSLIDLILFY